MHLVGYKVWVQIEKIVDPEKGGDYIYEQVGLPDCIGEFDTFREATAHVRSLNGWDFLFPSYTSDYQADRDVHKEESDLY